MDGGCDGVEKGQTVGGTTRIDNAEVEKNILYHDYEYANNQNALRELLGAAIGSDSDDTTYQPIDFEADADSALDIRFDDSEDEITKNDKFPEHVDNHTQLLDEFADVDEPQPSACQQTQEVISLNQVSCTQPPQPSQPQPDQIEPPELVVSENVGDNIGLFGEEMWEGVEAMMDEFEGSQMRTIDVDACSNHVSISECGAGRQRNQVDIDSHATGIPAQGSSRTPRKASTGRTKASNVHTSVALQRSPRFDKKT